MAKDFRVTITTPARAAEWLAAVGDDTVCVKSPIPHYATIPGREGPELVYDLDLEMLTKEQFDGLCIFLANKFSSPLDEVRAALSDTNYNLPILQSDCMLSVHNPQRWF